MTRVILTLPAWDASNPDAPLALSHPSHDINTSFARTSVVDRAFDAEMTSVPAGSTLIAWSGQSDADPDDPFAPDPQSWLPRAGAMPAFLVRIESLEPALRRHRIRLLIRPHARHIISDVPRAAALLAHQSRSTEPHIGLALDPTSLLEPSMLAVALDHIRRALGSLAHRASLVILTNVQAPDSDEDTAWLRPASLTDGLIPPRELTTLAAALIPAACPIAILTDNLSAQHALLRDAGYTAA